MRKEGTGGEEDSNVPVTPSLSSSGEKSTAQLMMEVRIHMMSSTTLRRPFAAISSLGSACESTLRRSASCCSVSRSHFSRGARYRNTISPQRVSLLPPAAALRSRRNRITVFNCGSKRAIEPCAPFSAVLINASRASPSSRLMPFIKKTIIVFLRLPLIDYLL